MSSWIIKAEGLGKRYRIQHQQQRQRYTALRDVLAEKARGLFARRKEESGKQKSVEDFWALKDVSFEIQPGEVVGIIGRNGAGKSTLLKLLSRITEPTAGKVTLRGRVASLLEVGTGFHPELTGRENIFLNGAILGMSRAEIRRKFDEIVAFAEVEKFLDTPVKRYSSGMYVRLAFAVAAHLEPEILVVDEVLAVGDAEFQKKCLGKMQDVAGHGRTVLFVSHNMAAVRRLCGSAILLQAGRILATGGAAEISQKYLSTSLAGEKNRPTADPTKPCITNVELRDRTGKPVASVLAGDEAYLTVELESRNRRRISFGMTIFNSDDFGIFSSVSSDTLEFIPRQATSLKIAIPTGMLHAGKYRVEGSLVDDGCLIEQSECYLVFDVIRTGAFDLAQCKPRGLLRLPGTWTFETRESKATDNLEHDQETH